MSVSRPLTVLTGVALLALAMAGCDRHAPGTIDARNGTVFAEIVSNPMSGMCHRFREGVADVANHTWNDLILYQSADCTEPHGAEGTYLGAQLSDTVVRSTGLWRSFSIVG